MSKNLVYCCVFYNKDYFKLLNLLLTSLKFFSSKDDHIKNKYDFMILTNENMIECVQELKLKLKMNILIKTFNFTTIFQAACARLFIFDYENINFYDKILYLDTDIIIKKNLSPIFDLEINDKLYGINSGFINSPSFGNQFFDFNKFDPYTKGINSGTLLFKNSDIIKDLFMKIRNHTEEYTKSGQQIPYCMDQPFINYHAISNGLVNIALLNEYISLYEDSEIVLNYETSIICHFSFPIGNFGHKNERMRKFMFEILKETKWDEINDEIFINKKYSWNSGSFEICGGGIVKTTWGNGSYRVLGKNKILVSWNKHDHILKFNDLVDEFMSIRIVPMDFEVVFGVRV
jgi:hypothetical protein